NAHPPIVEREVFMKANKIALEHKGRLNHKKFNNARHPLTGLLKCGKCGGSMVAQKRKNRMADGNYKQYRYYVCSTYLKAGRNVCSQANINADELEYYVYDSIKQKILEVLDDDYFLSDYSTHDPNEEINQQIKSIEKQITKNENKTMTILENK